MSTKILAITGCRSDYDLLSGLYSRLNDDKEINFGLMVTGAHLSELYGRTVQFIERDRLPIIARIESLPDSDATSSRVQSAATCLSKSIPIVEAFRPNLILYQGDREEVIVGALLGAYLRIPTVQFFSGDHSPDGSVDNPIRHAASKLSSLHFVVHPQHKERLLSLGEKPERIFVIGSPQLDKFVETPRRERKDILRELGCPNWDHYALLIQHPVHGEEEKSAQYFEDTLSALREEKIPALIAYPNSDPGSKAIISVMSKYQNDKNFFIYKSLERELFVNVMRHAHFLIGNSSAGLYETPIIPLGSINVGNRQRGRLASNNVLFVDYGVDPIRKGIRTVMSDSFQAGLKNVDSPFGDGKSVAQAYQLLKTLPFSDFVLKSDDPLKLLN